MSIISKDHGTCIVSKDYGTCLNSTRTIHEQCARPSITFLLHQACQRVFTSLKDEEVEQYETEPDLNRKRISSSSKRSSMASIQKFCEGVMETLKCEEIIQMAGGEKQVSDLSRYAHQHVIDAVNDSEEFRRLQAEIRAKGICTVSAMREALIHDYCDECFKEKENSNGKSTLAQESNDVPSKPTRYSIRRA